MLLHKYCPHRFLPTVVRHTNTLYTQLIHEYLFPFFKNKDCLRSLVFLSF